MGSYDLCFILRGELRFPIKQLKIYFELPLLYATLTPSPITRSGQDSPRPRVDISNPRRASPENAKTCTLLARVIVAYLRPRRQEQRYATVGGSRATTEHWSVKEGQRPHSGFGGCTYQTRLIKDSDDEGIADEQIHLSLGEHTICYISVSAEAYSVKDSRDQSRNSRSANGKMNITHKMSYM